MQKEKSYDVKKQLDGGTIHQRRKRMYFVIIGLNERIMLGTVKK